MALRKRVRKSLNHTKHSTKKQRLTVNDTSEEVPEFVVECICEHRINTDKNEIEFYVKWKDYGE
jgi:hypothetical protein